ncbi:hypothetical protein [Sneathiella sp.]|uniref:hypothetical protein n=1 Tax=Sneathiella sp. TaxID=1964365 RepID=UPI00356A1CF9
MPKRTIFSSFKRNLGLRLSTFNAITNISFFQTRTYKVASLPGYNLLKYTGPTGDRLGSALSPEEFQEKLSDTYKRLYTNSERESRTTESLKRSGAKIDAVVDIHGQKIGEPVISPIKNIGGQPTGTPETITYPAQQSDPIACVGGLIENVLTFSLESHVERNLTFAERIGELIGEGPGELSSILQYYVGYGAPVSFNDLNFLLESKGLTPLTNEQLADEEVVEKYVSDLMDNVLPASRRRIKIDMTSQIISVLQIQSPHSSVVLKYKCKDGTDGYIGAEVGRPSHTYVAGKLVENAHEQVVDPAVFQSMNRPMIDLPKSEDELDELDVGVTKDNFSKFDTKFPVQALPEESKPIIQAINLVDSSSKGKDKYLSGGTPGAITTCPVPNAKSLAMQLYFLTGEKLNHALSCGGYFAHVALTGQSRACEYLVVSACDSAGIDATELLPILNEVKQYDMSQEMRETIYENFLFIELSQGQPDSKDSNIFSFKSANDYLTLVASSFTCMQIYRDLLSTAAQRLEDAKILKKPDPEAQEIYDRIEHGTRNFMHRYEHMWAIAAYDVINIHRNYGIEALLDPVDENQTVREVFKGKDTSTPLTLARKMTNEKIKALKKQIESDTRTPNKGVKSVQQNSLDLAEQVIARLDIIRTELNQ